jgi:Spy/CpxP family protein refolding chaperone
MDKQRATLLLLASTLLLWLFSGSIVWAYGQQASPPSPPSSDAGPQQQQGWGMPPALRSHRPPIERALQMGPPGRWWDNPDLATKLSLTPDQQKKMDDIFQQNRLNLIDLYAAVQKQDVIMEPLLSAEQPDEAKIIAQIDRVAQARADLEKANARMLLGLRRVLTIDQWKKLQSLRSEFRRSQGMHGGPGRFGSPGPNQ